MTGDEQLTRLGVQLGLRPGAGPFRVCNIPLTPEQRRRRGLRAARRARMRRRGWA